MILSVFRLRFLQWIKRPSFIVFLLLLPLSFNFLLSELFREEKSASVDIAMVLPEDSLNEKFSGLLSKNDSWNFILSDKPSAISLLEQEKVIAVYELKTPLSSIRKLEDLKGSISVFHLPHQGSIMGINDVFSKELLHFFFPLFATEKLQTQLGTLATETFWKEYEHREGSFSLEIIPISQSFSKPNPILRLQKTSAIALSNLFFQVFLLFFGYFKIEERQSGCYKRLLSCGFSLGTIYLWDFLFISFISFFCIFLQMLLWSVALSFWHFFILLCVSMVHSSFILFLSSLFSNRNSFLRISIFIVLLLGFLGGGFVATESFPPNLLYFSKLSHFYWQNHGLQLLFYPFSVAFFLPTMIILITIILLYVCCHHLLERRIQKHGIL